MSNFPQSLHLIENFKKSEDYNLIKSIESAERSFKIFSGNYFDLKATLGEHDEKSNNESLWNDNHIRWDLQDKLVRLMYNFFSSAFSLVYHTRNHVRKVHRDNNTLIDAYQLYINKHFAGNPLHCFVIDFRNFLCHSSLPFIVSSKRFNKEGAITSFNIDKESLNKFKWEPTSGSFLEKLPNRFSLEDIITPYFTKVETLHLWYKLEQLRYYKDTYVKVISEKKDLIKLAKEDRITSALPFNLEDIEREEQVLQLL
jgi:hypothetical protein